jgi:hypothetical protein
MKSVTHDSLQEIHFYRTSEKPSKKSRHDSDTSNPNLPSHFINTDSCIIFKSACCSTVSTVTGIYTGRFGVQILEKQENYLFPKTSRPAPAPPHTTNELNTQLFLWQYSGQGRQSNHSHHSTAEFKNQWSCISTQPLCLHGIYIDTPLCYLNPLPMYISLNRSHLL